MNIALLYTSRDQLADTETPRFENSGEQRDCILTLPSRIISEEANLLDLWMDQINASVQHGQAETLKCCRLFHEARNTLEFGKWSQLWRREDAPFGRDKANALAHIGKWLLSLDDDTCHRLPEYWRILRLLSRLSPEVTRELCRSFQITPRLSFRKAEALVGKALLTPARANSSQMNEVFSRFRAKLEQRLPHLSLDQIREIAARVDQLVVTIRAEQSLRSIESQTVSQSAQPNP